MIAWIFWRSLAVATTEYLGSDDVLGGSQNGNNSGMTREKEDRHFGYGGNFGSRRGVLDGAEKFQSRKAALSLGVREWPKRS